MKRIQTKQYAMYLALQQTLNNIPTATLNKMPHIEEAINQFNNNIIEIRNYAHIQLNNNKGYTETKSINKTELGENIFIFGAAIKSYAIKTNNEVLQQTIDLTASKIQKLTDNGLVVYAGMLIKLAVKHISQLAPYGITPITLAETQQLYDAFKNYVIKPRNVLASKMEATKMLQLLFAKNNKLLKITIDTLVTMVKKVDSKFHNNYFTVRQVIKPMRIPFALRVNVVNEKNEPIHKVTIKIKGSNKKHKTSPKGTIHVKSIPEGLRTLTASIHGYITQTVKFPRTKTKRTDLRIILQSI